MIRRAIPSDLDVLTELIGLFPSPSVRDETYTRSCFIAILSDSKAYLAIAVESGGVAIGYLCGYRHAALYAGGETAWCDEVLVREDRRRHGVGKRLMMAFEEWAGQNHCVLVSLATAGAKEFYEALGYEAKASYFKKYLSKAL